ncbi:hypothetical protein B0I35DRAFT_480614 [Stachybotrys elegans]|uniref:Uncharacterized protein n=1 Tax=Stachybotrys elegans TaxID=80388 RepID=A0A8K0SQB8_9HYPO|nr:hypothetical protein B0I35DRAFT_480614 [Stachybotrys elegans]
MQGLSKEALCLIKAGASTTMSNGASLLNYLAIMPSEDIEAISQALYDRGVRARQAWCIGTFPTSNSYFFLDLIEGDAVLKAIGTNRLDVVKAIMALSKASIPESFEERKRYFANSIEAAARLHTANILEYLLTSLMGDDKFVEKKSIGRAWQVQGGDSLVRYTVSAEDITDRIAVHGSLFNVAAEESLRVLDSFGFIEHDVVFHSRIQSTLLCALETGSEEMATQLLSFDAIVNAINIPDPDTGFIPLHSCIRHGERSTFDRLMELGVQYKQEISYPPGSADTTSCLHICASHRADVWFAERLMDAGVSLDAPDRHGSPPLHMALLRQSYDLARLLIQRGQGLNRVLSTGLTVAGTLMIPTIRGHFHDFLGAMEFIFSLEDPHERPNFVINPDTQQTMLHMAVNAAADKFDAFTALILKHFHEPEHVNAKNSSGLMPLHVAIGNKNLSAVELLLDAGANASIPPEPGNTTLAMARSQVLLFGNQLLTPGQIPQQLRDVAKRSSAILSLIYRQSHQLEHVPVYSTILRLYEAIEPYIEQMRQLEHTSSQMLGLETIVLRIINQHHHAMGDMKDIFEYQQLLNSLVEPWIMVEATIGFVSVGVNDKRRDGLLSAATHIPWLGEFSAIGVDHIQQAALFEVVLQALEDGDKAFSMADSYMKRYFAYSNSRDPADLPESPMLVRYPYPLKDIYERILKFQFIDLHGTRDILRCLRYLDKGANPDRFSAVDPPAMTKAEFREFHLQILQEQDLRLEDLRAALRVSAKCGCHNHKIRKFDLLGLELLTQPRSGISSQPEEIPAVSLNVFEKASAGAAVLETAEQPYEEFDMRDLQDSLPTEGSGPAAQGDELVEHFGIFCAGVACANKIWSQSFIRGYVHGIATDRNSEISVGEHEKMMDEGCFVEQIVWETGWLDKSGQLTFEDELVPSVTRYPVTHYGFCCDVLLVRRRVTLQRLSKGFDIIARHALTQTFDLPVKRRITRRILS